jgi:hypothetical protein
MDTTFASAAAGYPEQNPNIDPMLASCSHYPPRAPQKKNGIKKDTVFTDSREEL